MMTDRRCSVCFKLISATRLKRHPGAILCDSSSACYVENQRRRQRLANRVQQARRDAFIGYEPPEDGSKDSSDPHFVARNRPCGRCGVGFQTSAAYRYFGPCCRGMAFRKNTPPRERAKVARPERGE